MHSNPQLIHARVERVVRQRITPTLYQTLNPVSLEAWQVDGDGEPVPASHALGLNPLPGRRAPRYRPFQMGDPWGPAWSTTWFRITGRVDATETITELFLDPGWLTGRDGFHGEGQIYRPDGTVVKAIHPNQSWIRLTGPGAQPRILAEDGSFTLYMEAAANPIILKAPPFAPTELGEKDTAAAEFEPYRFRRADVAAFRPEVWELLRDFEVIGGLLDELPDTEPRYWRLLDAVDHALDRFIEEEPESASAVREALAGVLDKPAAASSHVITAIGHAHIDSAWLWPIRETRRKVARTVANVLALMDADETFQYTMSSAQQFQWIEQDQPELFERLKEKVASGQFTPVGGMWVEPDAVLPSGEAMVRQITYGQRYFLEKFGIECDVVWLPDTFGYAAGLPQIIKRAGIEWFLTQKISWSDTNTFPHHSFDWEGIDGTRVFTHFPPADTYTAEMQAKELHLAQRNFRDKARSSHSLLPYGYGDGGGGPTREMLGRISRFADLEGSPKVRQATPTEFFSDAEAEYRAAGDVPVWRGELYLEFHRGTLTSQHSIKQGNRMVENMLRAVEHLAAAAVIRASAEYPQAELDAIWEEMLLLQFHDILPGSSIAWVHREANESYAALLERLTVLAETARDALEVEAGPAPLPAVTGGWQAPAPAGSVTVETQDHGAGSGNTVLHNSVLKVVINSDGHVTSLTDLRTGTELVPEGVLLGALHLFRDEPVKWDAWDVDRHTLRLGERLDTVDSISADQDAQGAVVTVVRTVGKSTFTQIMRLRPGSGELEFGLEADWQHSEHLLKAAFPLDVHAMGARFETQYGYLSRDIGENTSWQEAQFEVNQHRWLHINERDLAVGITNDSSYGCDVTRIAQGGTLARLSLLRASKYPDPRADIGHHRINYAVVVGDIPTTVDAAYRINAQQLPETGRIEALASLELETGAATIDWVKLADDGSTDVILRITEVAGGRATGILVPGAGLQGGMVAEADLLERTADQSGAFPEDLPYALSSTDWVPAQAAQLNLKPFQVATLRVRR